MRAGSFAPPSISPGSGVNLSLAWENVAGADPRKRPSSPLNLGGPLRVPGSQKPGEPSEANHKPGLVPAESSYSRSPENSRRQSHSGAGERTHHHSETNPREGSSAHRNLSPARAFAIPLSPRLQAFGSNRMRRSSSSSLSSSSDGSSKGVDSLVASSPPQRPLSPVSGPVNPDPQHAFDSVWPAELPKIAGASPSSSPNSSRRGAELLHNWIMDRRSGSRSPLSSEGRGSSPSRRTGAAFGTSPSSSRRNGGHRKSLSGSSAESLSPPSVFSTRSTSPFGKRQSTPETADRSVKPHSPPPESTEGFGRAGSTSVQQHGSLFPVSPQNSPISRVISPTTSSVKVDVQSVLAQAAGNSEETQSSDTSEGAATHDTIRESRRASSGSGGKGGLRGRNQFAGERFGTSPSGSSSISRVPPSPSPSPPPVSTESPPKTRSFIGMPPRSGYELSDDPDDVGSEDGTSSSVSSGGKEDSTDDEDDRQQREHDSMEDDIGQSLDGEDDAPLNRHSSDHEGEQEAFIADEEDVDATERRSKLEKDESDELGSSASQGSLLGSASRPHLPKRPSLTRSSAVPTMPSVVPQASPLSEQIARVPEQSTQSPQPFNGLQYFKEDVSADDKGAERSMWRTGAGTGPDSDEDNILLEGSTKSDEADFDEAEGDEDGSDEEQRDEESLTTLERIFLFAKSEMTYHRIIVSRSLPLWIREVELTEAVEYVIALLNGLATDDAEVCTAFASELHRIMWFFFLNCPLEKIGEDEIPTVGQATDTTETEQDKSDSETATRPRLPVGIFTPLICALLLNTNAGVAQTAQSSLVEFFCSLRTGPQEEDENAAGSLITHMEGREGERVAYDEYVFNEDAKRQVANELLDHVAFAIGRPTAPSHQNGPQASRNSAEPSSKDDVDREGPNEHNAEASDEEHSWDTDMQDGDELEHRNLVADDWRKASSPFDSSSPIFSAYDDRPDVDEEAAVGRMASVSLLGALSSESKAIDSSTVLARFVPEVLASKDDAAFYVRKESALALAPLSKHLSDDDICQRILPAYDQFCEDKNWHVRQAAVSSLPAIYQRVDRHKRRDRVVSHLRSFVTDVSRHVRTTALEIIGETIFLFEKDDQGVPPELLRFFLGEPFDETQPSSGDSQAGKGGGTSHAESPGSDSFLFADFGFGQAMNGAGSGSRSAAQSSTPSWSAEANNAGSSFFPSHNVQPMYDDGERPLVMAYNFPAVVLTTGGAATWHRLRQTHAELSSDSSPKVRQSLAASLHEVAKLVGSENTQQDLLPLLERFLSDQEEDGEIKFAALEHANVVLHHLADKSVALQALGKLHDLWSTSFSGDWRLREALALQIPALADDFVLEDEDGCLMNLMQMALSDPVSSVREAGVKATPALHRNFAEHDQTIADGVLGMLADMGEATAYRVRVGFLLAAHALINDPGASKLQRSSFQLILLPRLRALASDRVVDVRMALAKVVSRMCQLDELFASPQSRGPVVIELLHALATDASEYVRAHVRHLIASDDPILQASPKPVDSSPRKDLILGPADGGPHRPLYDSQQEGHSYDDGVTGDGAAASSLMMDFEQDVDGESSPFEMEEDEQSFAPTYGRVNGFHGPADDQDERLDSDLEMVNLDELEGMESSHESDAKLQHQAGTNDVKPSLHGGSGSTNSLGFAPGGFGYGLDTPDAAGDESFESTTSSEGDSNAEPSMLQLTSPDRLRPSFLQSNDVGRIQQQPSLLAPLNLGASTQSDESSSVEDSSEEKAASKEGTQAAVAGKMQDEHGDTSNEGQGKSAQPASDPFLSFVSSNLGGGNGEPRKKKKSKKSQGAEANVSEPRNGDAVESGEEV